MATRSQTGICKLCGEKGKFVKSHIIPKAFTKLENSSETRVEFESTSRTVKRHTSWYDQNLCTRKGEDILSDLDNWARNSFFKNSLVWSAWKDDPKKCERALEEDLRIVEFDDWAKLRRFGLSLLWRACASQRPALKKVRVSEAELERLRKAVVSEKIPPADLFPFVIIQLTTIGPQHNMTPINIRRPIPDPFGNKGSSVEEDCIRFYFDGLIFLFIASGNNFNYALCNPAAFDCKDGKVPIICTPYENSFQQRHMHLAIHQHIKKFPDTLNWLQRDKK